MQLTRAYFPNIQTVRATRNNKKHEQPNQKIGRRPKEIFLQRRHTDGQQSHEKILNLANYQRNENQNYNEVPPRTGQNGHHLKIQK